MRNSFLCAIFLSGAFLGQAQTDAEKVRSTVSKNDIEAHIFFLGSDDIDIPANYQATNLRTYRVKPAGENNSYYQQVKFQKVSPPESIAWKLKEERSGRYIYLSAENTDFKGDAVFLGYGTEQDFKSHDVKDKLVVVNGGLEGESGLIANYRAGMTKRMSSASVTASSRWPG